MVDNFPFSGDKGPLFRIRISSWVPLAALVAKGVLYYLSAARMLRRSVQKLLLPGRSISKMLNNCRPIATSATMLQKHPEAPQKKLFTPGPLGVSYETKAAMLQDLGSRDVQFMNTVKFIRSRLLELACVSPDTFATIPVQGSGTYAVEAVLSTVVPRKNGKVLILVNGAYGRRMIQIVDYMQCDKIILEGAEHNKADVNEVRKILQENPDVTTVSMVHCETSSGVIHPVEEVGKAISEISPNAIFFVDAMSSFGGIPLDLNEAKIDFMVSSANKCIEGVPGFSYAIGNIEKLMKCKGFARSLSLDLVEQYDSLEKTGQFRFTPPTHAMLAFKKALQELEEEGQIPGRSARYQKNREVLRHGMREMGFKEFLDDSHKGYIITSYFFPEDKSFDFKQFYQKLSDKGQVIYPGKVTKADCFRIGNIGHLFPSDMEYLLTCIKEVCAEMNVKLPIQS
ncbi:2-aminoethylphosphonate--pyruvate transaminase-like [Rhopilema esculentum]|uniref:2-aminoethylphosphonate--pyruvate transaminase-like n=1 Tax=Rhopilema esculentum TaxID=499914 RepID=UPI0031E3CA54